MIPAIPLEDLQAAETSTAAKRYCEAARVALRAGLIELFPNEKTADASIRRQVDDRPTAVAGKWFFALRPVVRIESGNGYQIDNVDVIVAVTMRTSDLPIDRRGETAAPELDAVCRGVASCIHDRFALASWANSRYPNEPPLETPLRWFTQSETYVVGPSHFWSTTNPAPQAANEGGLLRRLTFSGGLSISTTLP